MNIVLLASDVSKLWIAEFAVFALPASVVGAGIGWWMGRWYPCLLLSCASAIGLCHSHYVMQQLHHSLTLPKLLAYAAGLILPPVLVAMSAGYWAARTLADRRRRLVSAREQF